MRKVTALVLMALAIGTGAQPASAQAYQCRIPGTIAVPQMVPDGPSRNLAVTGYTLALSWSPEFCKGRETSRPDRTQCSGANGRFGFVVHGLWPESRNGWPQYCATTARLSPTEARRNLCMAPSASLLARQWLKHGSCMSRQPETYFKVTRILWNSLRFPDMDRLSREKPLTAGRIRGEIAAANAGIEPENIGVSLDRKGWLEEIHLCYAANFMPARCDRRHFGASDAEPAKIWRGL